jgi:arabinofuranosyltransferase
VSLLSALCWVNRFDSMMLFSPLLLASFLSERPSWRRVRTLLLGLSPAILWFGFAIIYFGFPFPNTAYAKLNTHIPKLEVMGQGVTYLLEAVYNDPISAMLMLFALALGASATRDKGRIRVLLASAILGTLYIISVGGDFMAGRFLTPILTVCSVILVRVGSEWAEDLDVFRWAAASSALIILSVPFSPLRDEPSRERMEIPSHGIANERAWYMFLDQVGLMMNIRRKSWKEKKKSRSRAILACTVSVLAPRCTCSIRSH